MLRLIVLFALMLSLVGCAARGAAQPAPARAVVIH